MAFEWVAGLFQSEGARGLSGESASAVALDEANPYYNYRLRRHASDGDLVADPGLLWYTSPYVTQRQGLGTHVAAEPGEGVANYTDVLLILSAHDHDRAMRVTGEPWTSVMQRLLTQEYDNFCRRENLQRPHAHRGIGFKVLRDGSEEMHGLSLGLKPGEFVTGLLPNLYTGPVPGSWPVIAVHVNLPGVWEGYREVGRLYNDQILFTLGNHWLDNFSHPALAEAALYRLQQYADGSFVHIINPDLQDRYQVTSTVQNGASVLTLATREGRPLAYIVLAVMDPPVTTKPATPRKAAPRISMPDPAPQKPQPTENKSAEPERGIPSVAPPMLIDDEVQAVDPGTALGGKTIIPDAPSERIFTLQERGALLQKVHFSAFMLGYDVYLGTRGELGTKVEQRAATFQVRKRSTSFVAHIPGVQINGRPAPPGQQIPLDQDCEIAFADTRLDYRDLRHLADIPGWPYVAEIRRPASSTYLIWGDTYRVGRSRECRVVLPDETANDNIHWKPKVGDGAYIRARTGDIPKANFYTDSIMVSSEHAALDLSGDRPTVACTASHCYVFVRRGGRILTLYPTSKPDHVHELPLQPGDEVLIGNCLFQVGYSAGDDSVHPAPAPEVQFSADSLADSVDSPRFDAEDAPAGEVLGELPPPEAPVEDPDATAIREPDGDGEETLGPDELAGAPAEAPAAHADRAHDETVPMAIPARRMADEDVPAATGLGEIADAAPAPVRPERGPDSILGQLSDFDDDISVDEPSMIEEEDYPSRSLPSPIPPSEPTFNTELGDPESHPDDEDEAAPEADEGLPEHDDPAVDETQPPPLPEISDEQPLPATAVPTPFPELDEAEIGVPPAEPGDPTVEIPLAQAPGGREVVCTDDADAQFELGRPCHVILAGWMVNGEVVVGNHTGADLVVPENRVVPTQVFEPRDYLRLKIRGRKGSMAVLSPTEVLIDEADPAQDRYDTVEGHTIDLIRRDEEGEEDFAVRLTVVQDRALPDPRARLVALDYDDPLAAALVTRGLPLNAPRTLTLGGVTMTLTWTGEVVRVSDYLDTYRTPDGFKPFFVQRGGKRYTTAPEDGTPFDLAPGDRFVVDHAVHVVRVE